MGVERLDLLDAVTLAMNRPVRFWAIDFSQPQTTSAAVISLPKMLRTPLRSVKT